jgi:hypothetical protein
MSNLKDMPYVTVEQVLRFRAEALAQIDSLQQQLKQREWISVDDRLPEDETTEKLYIVMDENDHRGGDVVNYHKIKGTFVDTYYHEDYPMEEITHWQAITPPTADKEKT